MNATEELARVDEGVEYVAEELADTDEGVIGNIAEELACVDGGASNVPEGLLEFLAFLNAQATVSNVQETASNVEDEDVNILLPDGKKLSKGISSFMTSLMI